MTRARRTHSTTTAALQGTPTKPSFGKMSDRRATRVIRRVIDDFCPDGARTTTIGDLAMVVAIMAAIGKPVEPAALVARWNSEHPDRAADLPAVLAKLEAHGHA